MQRLAQHYPRPSQNHPKELLAKFNGEDEKRQGTTSQLAKKACLRMF